MAHFVNKIGYIWTLPISLPKIYSSKTGENIAALLSGVLERYNITYKIGFLISNNTSLNNRAINLLICNGTGLVIAGTS